MTDESKPKRDDADLARSYQLAAPVLDAVWQMVIMAVLGTLGGWWADGKLSTRPWLLITGAVLGVSGGLAVFLRAALAQGRRRTGSDGK